MKKINSLLLLLFITLTASAQTDPVKRKAQFNLSSAQVAIKGYDPLSYFSGKPLKGSSDLSLYHQGVIYYFASAANKETFRKNPFAYEPQYGGWCAYAMGDDGSKVAVDPETYKILGGKLYLFYHSYFNNTLKSWNKNETMLMKNADINWAKFQH